MAGLAVIADEGLVLYADRGETKLLSCAAVGADAATSEAKRFRIWREDGQKNEG